MINQHRLRKCQDKYVQVVFFQTFEVGTVTTGRKESVGPRGCCFVKAMTQFWMVGS